MLDKKRRLFRLIENYMNDFQGNSVQTIYGEGATIRVHSMSESTFGNLLQFELVIVLGKTINESVIDDSLANILLQDALVYFFPNKQIQSYVRYDIW